MPITIPVYSEGGVPSVLLKTTTEQNTTSLYPPEVLGQNLEQGYLLFPKGPCVCSIPLADCVLLRTPFCLSLAFPPSLVAGSSGVFSLSQKKKKKKKREKKKRKKEKTTYLPPVNLIYFLINCENCAPCPPFRVVLKLSVVIKQRYTLTQDGRRRVIIVQLFRQR